jgi:hypothetical protein
MGDGSQSLSAISSIEQPSPFASPDYFAYELIQPQHESESAPVIEAHTEKIDPNKLSSPSPASYNNAHFSYAKQREIMEIDSLWELGLYSIEDYHYERNKALSK